MARVLGSTEMVAALIAYSYIGNGGGASRMTNNRCYIRFGLASIYSFSGNRFSDTILLPLVLFQMLASSSQLYVALSDLFLPGCAGSLVRLPLLYAGPTSTQALAEYISADKDRNHLIKTFFDVIYARWTCPYVVNISPESVYLREPGLTNPSIVRSYNVRLPISRWYSRTSNYVRH